MKCFDMDKKATLLKRIILFSLPFVILTVIYIITDPFMVIYKYDDFNGKQYIHKNRDFVSTEMFKKNSDKFIYDSFIFGSSTSLFIPPSIWSNYIETENKVFSFDASSERLPGLWSKVKYIDERGIKLKNALLVFDFRTFKDFDNSDPTSMKHFEVYHSSKYNFHYKYLLQFLKIEFLTVIIPYKLFNKFFPYMEGVISVMQESYDPITNEFYNTGVDQLLKTDSLKYYEERIDRFPPRPGTYREETKMSTCEHVRMLTEIKDILDKNNTAYKVLICPSYNQVAYNREDLKLTEDVFGKENVYNFTGINRFTEDKSNFYDGTHFKKFVGKQLLDSAYFDSGNASIE
jgi:hypothetical protein